MANRLFPALLRFWRDRRGFSQLALSLEADVSTRHLSFLESGRAKPSEEMVLRLASVLGVPLRDRDDLLRAAGFEARLPEARELPPEIDRALTQMTGQHEPYPLVVLSLDGTILRQSRGATALFGRLLAEPSALPARPDIYTLHFDERFLKPAVVGWESLARSMLSRLHHEALQRGGEELRARLDALTALPGVPEQWRAPDLTDTAPTLQVRYAKGAVRAAFLVTATTFVGPRQLPLDEVRIESCFPLDDETRALCEQLSRSA
ncbi:MAG: helix-turn-helix domain-containing protein [Myxococcaceae bacterium]|nr:helix-turn-helix domain-containing protein [Myxococcaceae bacterium]